MDIKEKRNGAMRHQRENKLSNGASKRKEIKHGTSQTKDEEQWHIKEKR